MCLGFAHCDAYLVAHQVAAMHLDTWPAQIGIERVIYRHAALPFAELDFEVVRAITHQPRDRVFDVAIGPTGTDVEEMADIVANAICGGHGPPGKTQKRRLPVLTSKDAASIMGAGRSLVPSAGGSEVGGRYQHLPASFLCD